MAVVNLTTFTEENVADWFATRDINKARPYVDLVQKGQKGQKEHKKKKMIH